MVDAAGSSLLLCMIVDGGNAVASCWCFAREIGEFVGLRNITLNS